MDTSESGTAGRRHGRLAVYLYSTKNIVGSALALAGLTLFFTGVIGVLWPAVVVGLYLIGALLAPPPRSYDLRAGFDPKDVQKSLGRLLSAVKGKVPDEVYGKVRGIAETIGGVLPRAGQLLPGSEDLFILQRTALDYLPTALENYMNLPRGYATVHRLNGGKTARQLLDEQLDLLGKKMDQVADAVHRGDTDKLMAYGRFLEDRFGRSDLLLEDPGGGEAAGAAGSGGG